MNQLISKEIMMRDIKTGFFGWVIFSNLVFFLFLVLVQYYPALDISPIFWILLALVATIVLFVKRRYWASIGIVAAFIANIGLWMFLLPGRELTFYATFPLPVGLLLSQ